MSEDTLGVRVREARRRVMSAGQLVHERQAHLDSTPQQQVDDAFRMVARAEELGAARADEAEALLAAARYQADCAYEAAARTYGADKDSETPLEWMFDSFRSMWW